MGQGAMHDSAIAGIQGESVRVAEAAPAGTRSTKPLPIGCTRGAVAPRHQLTFQVVFALLSLEFAGFGIAYLADPAGAVRGFSRGNRFLGGIHLVGPDVAPWRYVTAIGMITVALMCAMLLVDLGRNYTMIVPVAFFKAFNAALWVWYAARYGAGRLPVFYAAAVFDCLQDLAMVVVARLAYTELIQAGRP
jgi:hypothetical protein